MGLGERRGGRARAARHHHRRQHRNHHHHGHARVNLGGMFLRGGGGGNNLVQRRIWSGFVMIMVGTSMFMYGAVTTGITSSSYFGYSYQGIIFLAIGGVLTLTGIILVVKMCHLHRSAQAAQAAQGSTVVVQSGSTGMAATSNMQLQQNTSTVWTTGQSGVVPPPPPGYGQTQQGYPMGYPQGPSYPPGGQPMYPPPQNGQQPYLQPPPPGVAPPPGVGGVGLPPQGWQAGMQPAPGDGPPLPQVYQVQPAYPQPNQMTVNPSMDASGPQGYAATDDAPPPSYDEATKTQHIP